LRQRYTPLRVALPITRKTIVGLSIAVTCSVTASPIRKSHRVMTIKQAFGLVGYAAQESSTWAVSKRQSEGLSDVVGESFFLKTAPTAIERLAVEK